MAHARHFLRTAVAPRGLRGWLLPVVLLVASAIAPAADAAAERLRIAPDKRHLQRESGAPFFYLDDTAWALFHRLTREEADRYLQDHAEKASTSSRQWRSPN